MRMEHYLTFIVHDLWEVIVNGDSFSPVTSASVGAEGLIPPKTAEQKLERKNKLKAKSSLMLAVPNENLLKFHAYKYAKSLWEAIKNSLPLAWNNIALIMRNKSDLDTLSMDDLYNNLKVYESKIKGQSSSSSNSQNVDFVFSDNSSNTNETVNTAHSLDNEDLEQIDVDDLKEMDLKWTKVEYYNCHRRCHFARECRAPRNQGNRNRDAPTRNAPMDTSTTNALVVQEWRGGYDWIFQAEEGLANFALMAYTSQGSSSSSSLYSEVHTCSKECLKSYESLQKQYDQQREALNESNLEIIDKTGLGYDGQINESDLNDIHVNESKVLDNVVNSVFDSHACDDNQVNDSKDSLENPKTVRFSAPLIKEWESDCEDENVFKPKEVKKIVKPSFENIEFVNARNTTVENESKSKKPRKFSQSPKGNKRNWNGLRPID
nr:hypothetical protein [Tanacetum cinerariifolium]